MLILVRFTSTIVSDLRTVHTIHKSRSANTTQQRIVRLRRRQASLSVVLHKQTPSNLPRHPICKHTIRSRDAVVVEITIGLSPLALTLHNCKAQRLTMAVIKDIRTRNPQTHLLETGPNATHTKLLHLNLCRSRTHCGHI
jgi:hypothetical protein